MLLGRLLRVAVNQRASNVVAVPTVRTLRSRPAPRAEELHGETQPQLVVDGQIVKEKFQRYPPKGKRAQTQAPALPPLINVVNPDEPPPPPPPKDPVPKKVYTEEEEALFSTVEEIAKDDALKPYRISSFDAEFLDSIGPGLKPSFNVAALAEKVEVLQKLIDLGVSMYKWDWKPGMTEKILPLSWQDDCQPRIELLVHEAGVKPEDISTILTKNPLLLCEEMQHLEARLNYLCSSQKDGGWSLSKEDIARVVTKNPVWLSYSVDTMKIRFEFFRKQFALNRAEQRQLMIIGPRVLTCDLRKLALMKFSFVEEFGLTPEEIKALVLKSPRLLLRSRRTLVERFQILHTEIGYSHDIIVTFPEILTCRATRLKERLGFLRHLDRAQFDCTRPGYIAPKNLANTSDEKFVTDVAKSTMEEFENYIKTH